MPAAAGLTKETLHEVEKRPPHSPGGGLGGRGVSLIELQVQCSGGNLLPRCVIQNKPLS